MHLPRVHGDGGTLTARLDGVPGRPIPTSSSSRRIGPMSLQVVRAGISISLAVAGVAGIAAMSAGAERRSELPTASSAARLTVDTLITRNLRWRSVGPDRGGRSIANSGVKGQPKVAYFGATGGGLWKTTDGGATWAPVTDGQITSASVGAVAVSESDPNIVFIGTGES